MTLLEVIRDLDSFPEESTIYSPEPWSVESEAIVEYRRDDEKLAKRAVELGYAYFLEIFIAKELLEGWAPTQTSRPTLEQKTERVIHYAIFDA
jgi:hypothetical protein